MASAKSQAITGELIFFPPTVTSIVIMSFSFPILVDEDLLPCLADMEIPMDASALAKPTYEIVRPLFEHIVIMLTGVTR